MHYVPDKRNKVQDKVFETPGLNIGSNIGLRPNKLGDHNKVIIRIVEI